MSRTGLLLCIVASFVLASMINVYPLSFELARYRPMMLAIVLMYWAIYRPELVGVGVAFLVGLISDLLLDTHLGYQAFCAVVAVFSVRAASIYTKRLDFASVWILVIIGLTVYRLFLWLFQSFGTAGFVWVGFRGYVVSLLLFPFIWQALMMVNQKFERRHL